MAMTVIGTGLMAGGAIAPVEEPVVLIPVVEKNFYVGGNVQAVLGDRADFLGTDMLDNAAWGVGIQGGYTFLRSGDFSTSVEARYSYAWADRTLGDTGILSGFIKPAYDFGPVSGYALLGYSEVDIDALGTSDGFAWGLGVSGDINDDIELFVDYTVNPDFDHGYNFSEFDNEVITVGMNYKF